MSELYLNTASGLSRVRVAVPLATADTPGIVVPDNDTITVADGVISANAEAIAASVLAAMNGGTVETVSKPYHGQILNDADGSPAAVVIGSLASGGAEPWNIFGERKWIAVALRGHRNQLMTGWYGVDIPGMEAAGWPSTMYAYAITDDTTEEKFDDTFTTDAAQDSTKKTDLFLQGGHPEDSAPAAATWCRNDRNRVLVNGVLTRMDLPRISVAARVWQARSMLEAVAPGETDDWGFSFEWNEKLYNGMASSTVVLSRPLYGAWCVDKKDEPDFAARNMPGNVVPCLELPAD